MLRPGFPPDSHMPDPITHQLAPLVHKLTYGLLTVCLVLLPVYIIVTVLGLRIGWILVGSVCLLIPALLLTLMLLRQHQFQASVLTLTGGIILPVTLVLVTTGMHGPPFFLSLVAPIIFVGPLIGRRGRITVAILSILLTLVIAVLNRPSPLVPLAFDRYDVEVMISLCIMGLLTFFGDQSSTLLRSALGTSLAREQALADLNTHLEIQVAERTSALQETLQIVEQREQRLAGTLEALQSSQRTIQQLSAPIIPVLTGVLIAPLIGTFDLGRIAVFVEQVLAAVEQHRATYVAFDLTGAVLSTTSAEALVQAASTVQLLGAQVWLVGIRPEAAEMIVSNGSHMGQLPTYPDVQAALAPLMQRKV